jgi:hypothetical protein
MIEHCIQNARESIGGIAKHVEVAALRVDRMLSVHGSAANV